MATIRSEPVMLLFLVTSSFLWAVSGYGTMVGGRTEVSDVKRNEEVQELGRFAVEEFNRSKLRHRGNGGEEVVFSEVVEAQRQVVSGIKYYLKIRATQDGLTRMFGSVVVVKPWVQSKELLHFSPSSS